jgi:hypothetical protein
MSIAKANKVSIKQTNFGGNIIHATENINTACINMLAAITIAKISSKLNLNQSNIFITPISMLLLRQMAQLV